ncbi:MAG: hypothetical protein WAQ98_25925 [Blastocatellia bacterium]
MENLQIKSESLPNRCDICHQSDFFDPIKNICTRCSSVQEKIELLDPKNQSALRNLENQPVTLKNINIIYAVIMSTVFPFTVFLILLSTNNFINSWYISLFNFAVWFLITLQNIKNISFVRRTVGDTIKTQDDLAMIKKAINFNMMGAIFIMLFSALYFLFLFAIFPKIFGYSASIHVLLFSIIAINFAIVNKFYDTKLRTFKVDSKDSKIAQTYETWIIQWEEARFKLPD